jgi:hypothetical protein
MRKLVIATLLAVLASVGAAPLAAQPIEEKNLLKGKHTIEADLGYVYLHAPHRFAGMFIRVPDEEDIAEYRADFEEAYGKARAKYEKKLATYERRKAVWTPRHARKPIKPDLVSRETYSIGAIETRMTRTFGPQYVYDKKKEADGSKSFGYMSMLEPGTYIWYGTVVFDTNNGWVGQCMCMGSVQFDVKPGVITNLGNALLALPNYSGQETAPAMDVVVTGAWSGTKIETPEGDQIADYSLPESLQAYESEQANLRASGKINNFYGVMISRLAPIQGILGYDRDTVINEQTGERLQVAIAPQ